jgi:hypothetical protein
LKSLFHEKLLNKIQIALNSKPLLLKIRGFIFKKKKKKKKEEGLVIIRGLRKKKKNEKKGNKCIIYKI